MNKLRISLGLLASLFALTVPSGCETAADTTSGVTEAQCKSTPELCNDKCGSPPILVEVVDATTKKGIEGVQVAPPFTVDGKTLAASEFSGVCKITADKARTLCRINEKPNYVGTAVTGLFSFRIEAAGHKGATLKAKVPVRTDDCCCPFIPATDLLELPQT